MRIKNTVIVFDLVQGNNKSITRNSISDVKKGLHQKQKSINCTKTNNENIAYQESKLLRELNNNL